MAFHSSAMLRSRGVIERFLRKQYRRLTALGLSTDEEPMALRDVFVPLRLSDRVLSTSAKAEDLEAADAAGHDLLDLLDAAHRRERAPLITISGPAGSGKTTLLRWVAVRMADQGVEVSERAFAERLPVLIALREAPIGELESLEALLRWWLVEVQTEQGEALDEEAALAWVRGGEALVLLDGLDEVGGEAHRERVLAWVLEEDSARGETEHPSLCVITGRPAGWQLRQTGLRSVDAATQRPRYARNFDYWIGVRQHALAHAGGRLHRTEDGLVDAAPLHVLPLTEARSRDFVQRWYTTRLARRREREARSQSLTAALFGDRKLPQLAQLARRPAYLTAIASVHHTRGRLPHTRAALYAQLIDAYIDQLDAVRGLSTKLDWPHWDRAEKRQVLAGLAFLAHHGMAVPSERRTNKTPELEGVRQLVWSRDELVTAVRQSIQAGGPRFRTVQSDQAEQLTDYFIQRTGLLAEVREGAWQFAHLSFQEYLTALFLLDLASASSDKVGALERLILKRLGEPGWMEVGLLALAIDSERTNGAGHGPILQRLDPENVHHVELLASMLGGEELPLTPEERQAWLAAWMLGIARHQPRPRSLMLPTNSDHPILFPPLRLHSNHKSLATLVETTVQAAIQSESMSDAIWSLASQPPVPKNTITTILGGPPPPIPLPKRRWQFEPQFPLHLLDLACLIPGACEPPLPLPLDLAAKLANTQLLWATNLGTRGRAMSALGRSVTRWKSSPGTPTAHEQVWSRAPLPVVANDHPFLRGPTLPEARRALWGKLLYATRINRASKEAHPPASNRSESPFSPIDTPWTSIAIDSPAAMCLVDANDWVWFRLNVPASEVEAFAGVDIPPIFHAWPHLPHPEHTATKLLANLFLLASEPLAQAHTPAATGIISRASVEAFRASLLDEDQLIANAAAAGPDPDPDTLRFEWRELRQTPFDPVALLDDALSRDWDTLDLRPETVQARLDALEAELKAAIPD